MIKVVIPTYIGSYEIMFFGSMDGKGGKLQFSQSSGSQRMVKEVLTQDWEHHLRDRNTEELKVLKEAYQTKMDLIISKFHQDMESLMDEIAVDLEKLD